jgi:cytochrome c553
MTRAAVMGWALAVGWLVPSAAVWAADAPDTSAAPLSASALSRLERQRVSERRWRDNASPAAELLAGGLSDDARLLAQGERLYREGVRVDGQPLVGLRLNGQVRIEGAAAACVTCHRRSGLGAVEGTSQVAPISGRYLFDQDRRAVVNMNLRRLKSFNQRHEPYTLETLGRALREGVHESGRVMDALMPKFALSDTDVLALLASVKRENFVPAESRAMAFVDTEVPLPSRTGPAQWMLAPRVEARLLQEIKLRRHERVRIVERRVRMCRCFLRKLQSLGNCGQCGGEIFDVAAEHGMRAHRRAEVLMWRE